MAWHVPPLWAQASAGAQTGVAGSRVAARQAQMWRATEAVLAAVAEDVRQGLLETVGVASRRVTGERCAVALELPPQTDVEMVARAIDLENVEAWCEGGQVHVGIGPWYSTKDVDQVVLCATKVVHVLLGLHAAPPPQSFSQRMMAAVAQVLALLQPASSARDAQK